MILYKHAYQGRSERFLKWRGRGEQQKLPTGYYMSQNFRRTMIDCRQPMIAKKAFTDNLLNIE